MLTSRHLDPAAPNIACPRCGSAAVGPSLPGGPSESVLQLRSGRAPAAETEAFDEWLCRSCGLRWPLEHPEPVATTAHTPQGADAPTIRLADHAVAIDLPEVQDSMGLTSPHVATSLREAREARGITLGEAARGTRILERYLQALEANAPVEMFPAPAYARFFLRAYAEFLGLAPDAVVRDFDQGHPVHEEPVLRPLPDPRPRRRVLAGLLILVSVASLLAMAIVRFEEGRRTKAAEPGTAAAPVATAPVPSPVTRPSNPPPIEGVRAVLRLNDRSWVEAVGDGETLESGTVLEAGDKAVYRADRRLELTLGNAGGVHLEVNGEVVPTGGPGDVVRLTVRLRDGEIVTKTG